MAGTVGGDTGLYDSLLAAFRSVKSSYQPGYVNSVVLMTDGVNEDRRASRCSSCWPRWRGSRTRSGRSG